MNWHIFAGIVALCAVAALCVWCYYRGLKEGALVEMNEEAEAAYLRGFNAAKDEAHADLSRKVDVAYQNGRVKGFQIGVDHQKRIHAERARDAARRDGKGRFKKR
jgi:hypothetical protein